MTARTWLHSQYHMGIMGLKGQSHDLKPCFQQSTKVKSVRFRGDPASIFNSFFLYEIWFPGESVFLRCYTQKGNSSRSLIPCGVRLRGASHPFWESISLRYHTRGGVYFSSSCNDTPRSQSSHSKYGGHTRSHLLLGKVSTIHGESVSCEYNTPEITRFLSQKSSFSPEYHTLCNLHSCLGPMCVGKMNKSWGHTFPIL